MSSTAPDKKLQQLIRFFEVYENHVKYGGDLKPDEVAELIKLARRIMTLYEQQVVEARGDADRARAQNRKFAALCEEFAELTERAQNREQQTAQQSALSTTPPANKLPI